MKDWNVRSWCLTSLAILVMLLASACGNSVQLKGDSMSPTLKDGERLTVDRSAFKSSGPQRGDIVEFDYSGGKRLSHVVGLPGETIGIKGGLVYVNGTRLDEPYVAPGAQTQSSTDSFQVPEDSYFLMSDNREHANDSRAIGPIARSQIIGKVLR
ncbi:MAG: signal peptidase I [Dehalococcoidia bacterium]|nr:signal peptidase I [Dehalococcoidia bacterium]